MQVSVSAGSMHMIPSGGETDEVTVDSVNVLLMKLSLPFLI